MNYAYLRVSTIDKQEFTRQEFALKDYKIDQYFQEKISGTKKANNRPEFEKLIQSVKEGDTIYFESMSRMARSMQDLIETTNFLANKKKVKVVFIKENIVVGGTGMDAMTSLIFNIMGAFAQFERDLLSDRTKQALQAIKASGKILGRPRTLDTTLADEVVTYYKAGHSMAECSERFGVSKSTVHRFVKEGK